ncbi:sulfurtransferase [Magnetococcales bacterium HHB-1]
MEEKSLFVSTEWLESRLEDDNLRVVQVGGDTVFYRVHLPGAHLLPMSAIVAMQSGLPAMRPATTQLQQLLGHLGWNKSLDIVAYDVAGGCDASRLVWTLHTLGWHNISILDGGLAAWYQQQKPMVSGASPTLAPASPPEVNEDLQWLASREDVEKIVSGQESGVIIDTRTVAEYRGATAKPPWGHIPGAKHLDWVETLRGKNDPLLKAEETLKSMYQSLGLENQDTPIVLYCQTAHRAAHSWALLRHLGYKNVRLFDGSMVEWSLRGGALEK